MQPRPSSTSTCATPPLPTRSTPPPPPPPPPAPPSARTPECPRCDCDCQAAVEPDKPGAARRADLVQLGGRGTACCRISWTRPLAQGVWLRSRGRGRVEGTGGRQSAAEYPPLLSRKQCERAAKVLTRRSERRGSTTADADSFLSRL